MMDYVRSTHLVLEQVYILCYKHFMQKRRGGRTTWKEVVLTPLFIYLITGLLMLIANQTPFPPSYYELIPLPPLSNNGAENGIFSTGAVQNTPNNYIRVTHLYYSPSGNAGVTELMNSMQDLYPDVRIRSNLLTLCNILCCWAG
jgi:hypothetical protein